MDQVRELLLRQEEASPTASGGGSGSQPSSPADCSSSPTSLTSQADDPAPPRRRAARPRPRPISDYGQLVSRRYPVPEEGAELSPSDWSRERLQRHHSTDGAGGCWSEGGAEGGPLKQRPVSVIGSGEGRCSPDQGDAGLPSVRTGTRSVNPLAAPSHMINTR